MQLSLFLRIVIGLAAFLPTLTSAQTPTDEEPVFYVSGALSIHTYGSGQYGPPPNLNTYHYLTFGYTLFNKEFQWKDSNTIYGSFPGGFESKSMGWGVTIVLDWKASRVKSLAINGSCIGGFNQACNVNIKDIPMWTDGENFIFDVPQSLLNYSNVGFSWQDWWYDGTASRLFYEFLSGVESEKSYVHVKGGKRRVLGVSSTTSPSTTFQVMSNVQSRSAIAWFAPSSVMRTLQVYNTLGKCVKEILIQPNATSEEIAFHSLPTGHYTARLGSDAHSFAVWR